MLHIATLLPKPHGVKITDEASLWLQVVQPFLEALGYGPGHWQEPPAIPGSADREGHTVRRLLLYHTSPASSIPPDLLLVVEARRFSPGDLLERTIEWAHRLPVVPPLVAMVHPQRSGFVLSAFHTITRMPIGIAFPSPAALKSLAAGLRRVTRAELEQRPAPSELEAALSRARLAGDSARVASLLGELAAELQIQGRYAEAADALRELLEIRRREGPEPAIARVTRELGQVEFLLEELESSETHLMHALELYQREGNRPAIAATLMDLGGLHLARKGFDAATIFLEQSLGICRDLGDVAGEGAVLNNLAHVHLAVADLPSAARCLEQSLEITRALGEPREELITLYNLAVVYQMMGKEGLVNRMIREVRRLSDALDATPDGGR